jgi:hypothetical protein
MKIFNHFVDAANKAVERVRGLPFGIGHRPNRVIRSEKNVESVDKINGFHGFDFGAKDPFLEREKGP